MTKLKQVTDPAKLSKAASMLKADTLKLYAKIHDDHLVGVVKSQTDPGLVYSCRLGSDGKYSCGTQNGRACGGSQGSPCKHLAHRRSDGSSRSATSSARRAPNTSRRR